MGAEATPGLLKIGEVAERLQLSLRTIRFYEEEGLVVPSTRTSGGFRLYAAADVARLELIMRMKPLGFSVEEMGEVLTTLDALADPTTPEDQVADLVARLDGFRDRVEVKAAELITQAARGREFGLHLREVAQQHR